jgi:hypothetical protein
MNKLRKKEIREYLLERGIRMSRTKYRFHFSSWDNLSMFPGLPEDFLRKYDRKLHWRCIAWYNDNLSEQFICEYQCRFDISLLIKRGIITQKRLDELEFLMRKEIPRFELMEIVK